MPIYEFYCKQCNMLFNFLSQGVNTDKRPMCPRCGKVKLERQISLFSAPRKGGEDLGDDDMDMPFDEARMERAMAGLASEIDKVDEDNPQQAASLMRKMFKDAGMKMGDGMQEALSRMESGEDPEQIEQDLGDKLDENELFALSGGRRGKAAHASGPAVDDTLYTLD